MWSPIAGAFDYTLEMPESVRKGEEFHAAVELTLKKEEEVIIAGVKPPEDGDGLTITPKASRLTVDPTGAAVWRFDFILKGEETGIAHPESFFILYYSEPPQDPEAVPLQKEIVSPPVNVRSGLFVFNRAFLQGALDVLIGAAVVGMLLLIIKKRRKG